MRGKESVATSLAHATHAACTRTRRPHSSSIWSTTRVASEVQWQCRDAPGIEALLVPQVPILEEASEAFDCEQRRAPRVHEHHGGACLLAGSTARVVFKSPGRSGEGTRDAVQATTSRGASTELSPPQERVTLQ